MQRSSFLQTSTAIAACAVVACSSQAEAIDLVEMPGQFDVAAFKKLVSRAADVRQVWDAGPWHPQILGGVKNGLNGLQFGFGIKPERIATSLVAHSDSNLMLYSDAAWTEFQLGQTLGVHDPSGNVIAANIFAPARATDQMANPNDTRGYYQDASIATLQRRGVMFFACNTALVQHAEQLAASGVAKGKSATQIAQSLRSSLLPGVMLVPSGVATTAFLQSQFHYAYTTEQV